MSVLGNEVVVQRDVEECRDHDVPRLSVKQRNRVVQLIFVDFSKPLLDEKLTFLAKIERQNDRKLTPNGDGVVTTFLNDLEHDCPF